MFYQQQEKAETSFQQHILRCLAGKIPRLVLLRLAFSVASKLGDVFETPLATILHSVLTCEHEDSRLDCVGIKGTESDRNRLAGISRRCL